MKNLYLYFQKSIFLLIIIFIHPLVFAQETTPEQMQIIPPSPDAASLGKYADIPVSTYTGVPNISIPLYEVKSRDITVPITLSYHAGGIRVEEEASWVGLGWSLNAGGVITRTVRGVDDFLGNTYRKSSNKRGYLYAKPIPQAFTPENIDQLQYYCSGTLDGQPDLFYFNFMGYTGKFVLEKKNSEEDVVSVRLQSNDKMKVSFNEEQEVWSIWTKDGYRFDFGTKEYTESYFSQPGSTGSEDAISKNLVKEDKESKIITAWYLDKITSPTGEEVFFKYAIDPATGESSFASRSVITVSETRTTPIGVWSLPQDADCAIQPTEDGSGLINTDLDFDIYFDNDCLHNNGVTETSVQCTINSISFAGSQTVTYPIYLREISFRNGRILFNTSDRKDMATHTDPASGFTFEKPQKLDEIIISNKSSETKKQFSFLYTYFNGEVDRGDEYNVLHYRLKLDQLLESNGSLSKPPYQFAYFDQIQLPAKNSKARDHWGYFNKEEGNDNAGPANRATLIPPVKYRSMDNTIVTIPGAVRDADSEAAKTGILTRINYPTGGNTTFTYENNIFNIDKINTSSPTEPTFRVAGNNAEVFELTHQTVVTINSELRCTTMSCYGSPTDTVCALESGDYHVPYATIVNLQTNTKEFIGLHADYECTLDPANCTYGVKSHGKEGAICGVTRNKAITLSPGRYLIRSTPLEGFKASLSIYYEQPQKATDYVVNTEKMGGGLRIQEIRDHDGVNEAHDIVRKYNYSHTDENGINRSTGKLMSYPKYFYGDLQRQWAGSDKLRSTSYYYYCMSITGHSYSNVPLGSSAQGNFIGYDQVTEIRGKHGEYGKTVYYYKNEFDEETMPYLPNSPTRTHSVSNGLLIAEEHFDRNGFKVKEVRNEYKHEEHLTKALMVTSYRGCGGSTGGTMGYKYYEEPSEWWYPDYTLEKTYDLSDQSNQRAFTTKTIYTFNSHHKQVIHTSTKNSKGEEIITEFTYPLDDQTSAPEPMWKESHLNYKHMHSQLLRQEIYTVPERGQSKILIAGVKHNFQYLAHQDMVLPISIEQANNGYNYEIRARYQYDGQGNLVQFAKTDDLTVTYLWGYNQTLPIAKVINASYQEVIAKIPERELNILEKSPSQEDIIQLHQRLQIEFPQAQVTTYAYNPLTGTTTVTDPNHVTTYYEYDDLQRLEWIKDHKLNKLSEYKYQYKPSGK